MRDDIAYLRGLISGSGDAISIRDALQQLEQSAYKIAEAMYATPGRRRAAGRSGERRNAETKP